MNQRVGVTLALVLAASGCRSAAAPAVPASVPPQPTSSPVAAGTGVAPRAQLVVRATSQNLVLAEYREGERHGWLLAVRPLETTTPVFYVEFGHPEVTEAICRASVELLEYWVTVYNEPVMPEVTFDPEQCAGAVRQPVSIADGEPELTGAPALRWDDAEAAWYVDDGYHGVDTAIAFMTWMPAATYEKLSSEPPESSELVDGHLFGVVWQGTPSHLEPAVDFMATLADAE